MERNENWVLLHGDVDAIKEFVFETSSLPQIRGGSQVLLECEDEVKKKIDSLGGKEIYCSGGSFLFKVPAEQAEVAKEAIEKIYLERTRTATVTVVFEDNTSLPDLATPPQDGWAKRLWEAYRHAREAGDFSRRVALLSARVRQAKMQKHTAPFLETFPFGKRCERCGKRLALATAREPVEEGKVLCAVCWQRDKKGRSKEKEIRGKFNQEFWTFLAGREDFQARQPQDLDTLVKSARRKYVAFLYADGNDIGKLLQRVHSKEAFEALSEALEQGTQQALFEALQEVCSQELQKSSGYWPFEIVNIGGDDVTLLIQAGYAWEVAVRFLEGFETHVQRLVREKLGHWPDSWPQKITASCGIAIADVKYPVRYLEYLASDLLKRAKQEAKADPGSPRSAVTFLWLPNPVAAEKVEPLMAPYQRGDDRLTARPYTLERARKLSELVEQASRWPRARRHRWGEALAHGALVSLNTVYYDIARGREKDRVQFTKFLDEVGRLARQKEYRTDAAPLWQIYEAGEKTGLRTALLDVLELAELRAMRPDVQETEER